MNINTFFNLKMNINTFFNLKKKNEDINSKYFAYKVYMF